jgi:hypothetical protein
MEEFCQVSVIVIVIAIAIVTADITLIAAAVPCHYYILPILALTPQSSFPSYLLLSL